MALPSLESGEIWDRERISGSTSTLNFLRLVRLYLLQLRAYHCNPPSLDSLDRISVVVIPQESGAPAWSIRLAADLDANDQAARKLVAKLTEEQLNWQPAPGSWSVGQCLEHLCITNEAYLPPISVAVKEKPDSPVEEITPGWFGRWFIRSFIEPLPVTKRAPAPVKIRPTAHVGASVLERFLAGNECCRELMVRARAKNVNRIRFWNPLIPGIRFTVGTGLQIIVGHERRHLLQAERVLHCPSFPRQLT
jgi:hypothetical protein